MESNDKIKFLHLDERNHVEEPFLRQLEAIPASIAKTRSDTLGKWRVLRLEMGSGQMAIETQRDNFDQVLLKKDLEKALIRINPWLDDQQLFEAVRDLTTFEGDNLYKNNQYILELLLRGTKVQRQTEEGLRNEDVFYIDFE